MKKILITGKNGLVGSAIMRIVSFFNHEFIFVGREDYNLMDNYSVKKMLSKYKPDYVINTAASVGGIGLNLKHPSEQFYNNIIMNTQMIHECMIAGVEKFISFSSVCAFPSGLEILKEEYLHEGAPYPAHFGYAHAKRISDIQIGLYRNEFNLNYLSVIPVNIFGKNDNYNLEKGHVIPSLIHKCFIAKKNKTSFNVWGNGEPKREFIYSEDLAKICLELLSLETTPQKIIISSGKEHSILDIVNKICHILNYENVFWEKDKPNGQLKRPSDITLFNNILPEFKFSDFDDKLEESINWFTKNYPNVRL